MPGGRQNEGKHQEENEIKERNEERKTRETRKGRGGEEREEMQERPRKSVGLKEAGLRRGRSCAGGGGAAQGAGLRRRRGCAEGVPFPRLDCKRLREPRPFPALTNHSELQGGATLQETAVLRGYLTPVQSRIVSFGPWDVVL